MSVSFLAPSLRFSVFDPMKLKTVHSVLFNVVRHKWNFTHMELPSPKSRNFRREIEWPEKYTIKPLNNKHLAGRDPDTGRVVVKGLGGGIKQKYHWVDLKRFGPTGENDAPRIDRVLEIIECGCRTAKVALVGCGTNLKYIIATVNMKPGDMLVTSGYIPRIPVNPNEGDAYPLGALSKGTKVHCIEKMPGEGAYYVMTAGSTATILRQVDDRVIIQLPSKLQVSLSKHCMASIGQISNANHFKEHIGSPNRNRELGNRPRSGLWQRKTGRFGRKIRPPPPLKIVTELAPKKLEKVTLELSALF
ncbi:39S ribosomal protein L2, mitochondrial [Melanaphis sacchari]|uniref:39S ribosomal protein L2, mitochondrial n=1 Tax=Melanaphis sacchari TaxID=742174 RepID=A0A2H8TTE4_9HEMI|nr:39S ribosomal protein L2, mitochondrial [Melanaphis sacchari]